MGFTSKSFLGLFRNVNGSLYGSNLVLCRALSWALCSLSGYEDCTSILANVVCPPNALSKFQFNALFFLFNLHKYCVILIKELNCRDPLKMKNLFENLQFPLTWNLRWDYMVLFMISFLHRCANTHRNTLFYIPYVREVWYCRNEMCEERWCFVSEWWVQMFLREYKWKRETTWQISQIQINYVLLSKKYSPGRKDSQVLWRGGKS